MKLFLTIWFLCGVSSGLALAQSSNQPPDLNFAVGEQFYATKNYLQALQNYQQALVTDSKSPLVYERMGDCYEALNQDDKALNAFKWAHYYDPQNKRLAQKLSDLSSGVVSSTSSDSFFVPHSPPIKGLSLSLSPLVSIPLGGNTANQFNMGWGGQLGLNYELNPHLTVGLEVGFRDYLADNPSTNNNTLGQTYGYYGLSEWSSGGSLQCVPVMAVVKYNLEGQGVRPYGILGAGLVFNSGDSWVISFIPTRVDATTQETDFVLSPGLGLDIPTGNNVEIFIQVSLELDFTSNNNSDNLSVSGQDAAGEPASGTVKGNLTGDNPTVFLPFQIGIRFGLR